MRIVASLFIVAAAVIQLLLGGLVLFSAVEARNEARTQAGDLSSVSSDLVSEKELAAMRAAAEQKAGSVGHGSRALGMATMGLGLLLLVAGPLALLRRGTMFVLGVGVISVGCLLATLLLEGGGSAAATGAGLIAVAIVLVDLDRRRQLKRASETQA